MGDLAENYISNKRRVGEILVNQLGFKKLPGVSATEDFHYYDGQVGFLLILSTDVDGADITLASDELNINTHIRLSKSEITLQSLVDFLRVNHYQPGIILNRHLVINDMLKEI